MNNLSIDGFRVVVNGIAEAVEKGAYPPLTFSERQHRGHEGALLYGYMALALNSDRWLNCATEHLNSAIDRAHELKSSPSLYGGLTGLGWVVEHLARLFQGECDQPKDGHSSVTQNDNGEESDLNADIDTAVINALKRRYGQESSYDLVSGLVGLGVYFLERLPARSAVHGLKFIFDELENRARREGRGSTWHTSPELLPKWQRDQFPGGYYNLGVAHGIPGILFFLNELVAVGIEEERALNLLDRGMLGNLACRSRSDT